MTRAGLTDHCTPDTQQPEARSLSKALPIGFLLVTALSILGVLVYRSWTNPANAKPIGHVQADYPMAPKFQLTDISGSPLKLSDYLGKVVLLDFWATWCSPCRSEIPGFVELQEKYRAQGLRVIGMSLDDEAEPVREFYKRFAMNYPVAIAGDPISELYGGVEGLPTTFLIGRDGRIYDTHIGARDSTFFEPTIKQLLDAGPGGPPHLNGGQNAPIDAESASADSAQPGSDVKEGACKCGCAMKTKQCSGTSPMCDRRMQAMK
jgi:thiol-disulfide isomerase/thioredoxin